MLVPRAGHTAPRHVPGAHDTDRQATGPSRPAHFLRHPLALAVPVPEPRPHVLARHIRVFVAVIQPAIALALTLLFSGRGGEDTVGADKVHWLDLGGVESVRDGKAEDLLGPQYL